MYSAQYRLKSPAARMSPFGILGVPSAQIDGFALLGSRVITARPVWAPSCPTI